MLGVGVVTFFDAKLHAPANLEDALQSILHELIDELVCVASPCTR